MGENKVDMNLFERALIDNEEFQFFTGIGIYNVNDRDFGGHWPYGSYTQFIIPYVIKIGEENFEKEFFRSVITALNKSKDLSLTLSYVVVYLSIYFNSPDENLNKLRVKNLDKGFIEMFEMLLVSNRENLIKDKRHVGVDWYKQNKGMGIYGGLLLNLDIIRKRGGPNLVPKEFESFFI